MGIPIQALPKVVQQLAVYLPPYQYTQLALGRLGMDRGVPVGQSLAVLALFTWYRSSWRGSGGGGTRGRSWPSQPRIEIRGYAPAPTRGALPGKRCV
jgi:hypothetical protein